ncbi:MAG TPA: transketolase C-terminal domain-containing protein, partial [Thermoanaerobaculia bacterium]|nr:transketolase C-terminal domain-containing protein [Thermoanaerobaculia bacterium]
MPELRDTARALARRLIAGPPPQPPPGERVAASGRAAVQRLEALAGSTATRGAEALGQALGGRRTHSLLDAGDPALLPLAESAARRHTPLVLHVATGGDHAALHRLAAAGAAVLVPRNLQEAVDLALAARRLAETALCPCVVALDPELAHGVQDAELPPAAAIAAYLGAAADVVDCPTAAQRAVFGRHRRRVPRWADPDHPRQLAASPPAANAGAAAVGEALFFRGHRHELLAAALAELGRLTGRPLASCARQRLHRAELVLVALGVQAEVAESVAAALRQEGRRVGVLGLLALSPLPVEELRRALPGKRPLAVLERAAPVGGNAGELLAALRANLAGGDGGRGGRRILHGFWGLGGDPLRAGDLASFCRAAAAGEVSPWIGVSSQPGEDEPWRRARRDQLARAYPALGDGFGVTGAAADRGRQAGLGIELAGDAAPLLSAAAGLLQAVAGGHLRGVAATAGRPARLTWCAAPIPEPGADAASDLTLTVRPGTPTVSVRDPEGDVDLPLPEEEPALRSERLLGVLCGVLRRRGSLDVTPRRLLAARRVALAANRPTEAALEPALAAFTAGLDDAEQARPRRQEAGSRQAAARVAAPTGGGEGPTGNPRTMGPQPANAPLASATGGTLGPLDDRALSWHGLGLLHRQGRPAAVLPDPLLTCGVVPAATAPLAAAREKLLLPLWAPAPCTACGACWSLCPEGAVAARVLPPAALLEEGMARAKAAG